MPRQKMTTADFIAKAKKIHGDFYDYSETEYVDHETKVKIICPIHGAFWQYPSSHLQGYKCIKCGRENRKFTTEEFIRRARLVHGDKYDYSKVKYIDIDSKVCIICPKHGEFWQRAGSHLNGNGCTECWHERHAIESRMTTEKFVQRAREIHGDKYDYSKTIYTTQNEEVIIICPKHGEFKQKPFVHLYGHGCKRCSSELVGKSLRKGLDKFIEEARKIHGDKYDYSNVVYKDSKTKVCIICHKHGEFFQRPSEHLRGKGCKHCHAELVGDLCRSTLDDFLHRAKEVHGDTYDYSLVDFHVLSDRVKIICPVHGLFEQRADVHLKGCGCPRCKCSWGERRIDNFLQENGISFERQYKIQNTSLFCDNKAIYIDFYLPQYNVAIEYNGQQHYEVAHFFGGKEAFYKRQMRDDSVRFYCKENKIKLIEIPYTEYDNIEEILTKELNIKKHD